MTRLERLEKWVSELTPEELEAFSAWFETLQAEKWDVQFETDAQSGALDRLASSAISEFHSGRTKPL